MERNQIQTVSSLRTSSEHILIVNALTSLNQMYPQAIEKPPFKGLSKCFILEMKGVSQNVILLYVAKILSEPVTMLCQEI